VQTTHINVCIFQSNVLKDHLQIIQTLSVKKLMVLSSLSFNNKALNTCDHDIYCSYYCSNCQNWQPPNIHHLYSDISWYPWRQWFV